MAAYETIVYLDISRPQGAFVGGLAAFLPPPPTIGPFIQGQAVPFRIYPVVPLKATQDVPNPGYTPVSLAGLNFELVIGPRAGSGGVGLASVDGGLWSVSTDGDGVQAWTATLDLNTSAMNTAIGNSDTLATYLEFRIAQDGGAVYKPVAQISVTVVASVRDPGAVPTPSTPDPTYITMAQALSLFVHWNNPIVTNNWGRNVILASPDGNRSRELGVGNDGSPIDNET